MKIEYSPEEVDGILQKVNETYGTQYVIDGNDETLHFVGLSPKETRWRLEPWFELLQECPTRGNIHRDDNGWWYLSKRKEKVVSMG